MLFRSRNSFLFSGEEPVTKANSGGGSKNRVIEIAIDKKMVEDGHRVSNAVQEHYGFAGRRFIEFLQEAGVEALMERYRELFEGLCRLDTTDKQAMAMACIVLADELAGKLFFDREDPLTITEAGKYLQSAREVDVAERAYQMTLNWAAKNPVRFENPKDSASPNKGEAWGKMEKNEKSGTENLVVNKDVLVDFLEENGFDYMAVSKQWAEKGYLIRNSQGKYVHQTKVYGFRSSYIKLLLPVDDDETDPEGFMRVDYQQMELPFD